MRIAALTGRSFYSLLRGAVSAQRLVHKAIEYGYGAIALADVNSMSGVVDFCQAARQANIKPIIGVEILTDSQKAVLLAEDRTGYKNLCRITTARNLDEDFDLVEQLKNNSRGVVCICNQSELLRQLKRFLHPDCLFAGCAGAEEADFAVANKLAPIAYTNFNCLEDDNIAMARLLAEIRKLRVIGSGPKDNSGFSRLAPEEQFKRKFSSCPQAIRNAEQIIQRCNFQLLNGKYYLPEVKRDKGKHADRELAKLCHVGLAKKYNPVSKEIVKRLEYELAVVRKKKFSDYFLVVYESGL